MLPRRSNRSVAKICVKLFHYRCDRILMEQIKRRYLISSNSTVSLILNLCEIVDLITEGLVSLMNV